METGPLTDFLGANNILFLDLSAGYKMRLECENTPSCILRIRTLFCLYNTLQ